jgi:hypothetical protein
MLTQLLAQSLTCGPRWIMVAMWRLSAAELANSGRQVYTPNMKDLSAGLHGCWIFSKLDLKKWYYQIPGGQKIYPRWPSSHLLGSGSAQECHLALGMLDKPSSS